MSPKKEQNSQKEVKKTEIHPKKKIAKKKILMVHLNLIEFGKKNRKQRRIEKRISPV